MVFWANHGGAEDIQEGADTGLPCCLTSCVCLVAVLFFFPSFGANQCQNGTFPQCNPSRLSNRWHLHVNPLGCYRSWHNKERRRDLVPLLYPPEGLQKELKRWGSKAQSNPSKGSPALQRCAGAECHRWALAAQPAFLPDGLQRSKARSRTRWGLQQHPAMPEMPKRLQQPRGCSHIPPAAPHPHPTRSSPPPPPPQPLPPSLHAAMVPAAKRWRLLREINHCPLCTERNAAFRGGPLEPWRFLHLFLIIQKEEGGAWESGGGRKRHSANPARPPSLRWKGDATCRRRNAFPKRSCQQKWRRKRSLIARRAERSGMQNGERAQEATRRDAPNVT